MKTFSWVAVLLSLGIGECMNNSLLAQTVDVNDAIGKAVRLKQRRSARRGAGRGAEVVKEPKLAYTGQDQKHTYYYAIDYAEGGYAIIGGDAVAREVLGYADEGSFDYEHIPEGLKDLLASYEQEIAFAIEHPELMMTTSQTTTAEESGNRQKTDVDQILKTTWGQWGPYNWKLPTTDFPTGCVATALAQVMNYWKYPTKGTGSKTLTQVYNGETYVFEADFENTTYEWSKMLDNYSSFWEEEAYPVATLMLHVGVAVDMEYTETGSWAYSTLVRNLKTYFGYNQDAMYCSRDKLEEYGWQDIIYQELKSGHPVYYDGDSEIMGGHAFVIDGYNAEENTFHVNWGWSGQDNGNYGLSACDDLHEYYKFNKYQGAWLGLVPDKPELKAFHVMGMKINRQSAEITLGGRFQLMADTWPEKAENRGVVWTSSNPEVATVSDNGLVTGVSAGTCTIYADAADGWGVWRSCEITVPEDGIATAGYSDELTTVVPFGNDHKHSITQMLYTSDELGEPGFIESISFLADIEGEETSYDMSYEIYLELTEKDELDSDYPLCLDWPISECEEASIGGNSGWKEFSIDYPFYYDDRYNLVVSIKHKGGTGTEAIKFSGSKTEKNRCIYWASDEEEEEEEYYEGSGGIYSKSFEYSAIRPKIRMKKPSAYRGQCGDELYYAFDKQTGQMRLYGEGAMYTSFGEYDIRPWARYPELVKSAVIEEGPTRVNGFFSSCDSLKSISISASVTNISLPEGRLVEIKVDADNPIYSDGDGHNMLIKNGWRLEVSGVENGYVPEGISNLNPHCFENNQSKEIVLPNSLSYIGYDAFCNAKIERIYIPEEVYYIGSYIFDRCQNLTSIIVSKDNTDFDSRGNCNAIISSHDTKLIAGCNTSIIPEEVTEISQDAFSPGPDCETLNIPEGVNSMSSQSLRNSVRVIKLPSTLQNMYYSFRNFQPKRLYVGPVPLSIYAYSFSSACFGNKDYSVLYVPQGCIETYQQAETWKKFKEIREYCDLTTLENLTTMLYSQEVSTRRGEQVLVPLILKNEQALKGFGGKMELPKGVVPALDKDGKPVITFEESRCGTDMQYTASWSEDGVLTFACQTNGKNIAIGEEEEDVAYVKLEVTLEAHGGGQLLQLSEMTLTAADGTTSALLPYVSGFAIGHYPSGDVNQDGVIDQVDAAAIADYINEKDPGCFVEELADPNGDGTVSISDVAVTVGKSVSK